jgi:hypothetical protein
MIDLNKKFRENVVEPTFLHNKSEASNNEQLAIHFYTQFPVVQAYISSPLNMSDIT